MSSKIFASIPDYISALPGDVREIAESIRQTIIGAAPGCAEGIRYGIPAFRIEGRTVIYFAVWKQHVGLYPIYRGSEALEAEIAAYRAGKDTIRLPLSQPMPLGLVAKIVYSQLSRPPEHG